MDGKAVCRDPEWALSGLGRETFAFSARGEKASVHRGMRTTMVGPRPEDDLTLGLHLWLLGEPMFRGTYVSDEVATR